jgi:hypothetical protein
MCARVGILGVDFERENSMTGSAMLIGIHVAISLLAAGAGGVVLYGLTNARPLPKTAAVFLVATVATCITGFCLPMQGFTPALGTGVVALLAALTALLALYVYQLAGPWRSVYVVGAVLSLYMNLLVFVVQAFQKIPALHALAPKGSELPVVATQFAMLMFFAVAGVRALRRFRLRPRTV